MPALPLSPVRREAVLAVARALDLPPESFAASTPPDPALGDVAVGCFPASKALRQAPPAIAARVATAFQPAGLLRAAAAAGPYVNFKVDRAAALAGLFAATLPVGATPIPTTPGAGKTVCIDFSSPNIAKQLAYHHIRSTVIGHALCNIHRALGYRTVGINHLGDWGTTFGMLLAGTELWGLPEPLDIAGLNDLYVRFRAAMKTDPTLEPKGRAWFKRLEDGDETARRLWTRFREISLAEFQEVYDVLGIRFDEVRGESEYEHDIAGVIRFLEEKGLTSVSEDALVVDLTPEKMPPLLLRKADGATLYATRDLAAAMYRERTYHFDRSLYVTDKGQGLHFAQLFAALAKAGCSWAAHLEHVPFGLVRLGGKKASTRSGPANVVLLKQVLAEAAAGIRKILDERQPAADEAGLGDAEKERTARQVGIGAVVFANLVAQREKDVDFEWEEILSFSGDAAPQVQYAHARACSILRKAGVTAVALADADTALLVRDEEWALAGLLGGLADETLRAAEGNEPHVIARFLLDVCAAFARYYQQGKNDPEARVLCGDERLRRARLALVAATARVLSLGLGLLGIDAPEAM